MASNVILHYYDGRGKAECIRLMLAAAGVPFKEMFLSEPEHMEQLKSNGDLLFDQTPMLEIDGQKLVQSGAIVRYIARKYGLFGKDECESVRIDVLTEGARDFLNFFKLLGFDDDAKLLATIRGDRCLPRYLPVYEKILEESKSGYLVGHKLSLADVSLLEVLLHLPERTPEALDTYPKLKKYIERISALPQINAYLKGPQRKGPNTPQYAAVARHVLQNIKF